MSVNQLAVSAKRLFVSACVATGTTGFAARRLGVDYFLPQLFVTRYAAMGGLDPRLLAEQLAGVHSFADDEWCSYWNRIAEQHESTAQRLLREWDAAADPEPLVIETSGSTASPKRVVLSRAAMRASALATQ